LEPHDHPLPPQAAESLARIARLLTESLDPREVAARVVDSVGRLVDPVAAAVYELTDDGDLVAVAVTGDPGPAEGGPLTFSRGTGLGAVAVAERVAVSSDDVLNDPRVQLGALERARLAQAPYRAALAVPLLARGRVIGVLGLGLRAGHVLDAEARRLVDVFADQAALAFDNARLHAETRAAHRRLELEHRVARILAEALTVEDALKRVVESLVGALGWRAGGFWRVDRAAGVLRCLYVWSSSDAPAPRFEAASRALALAPGEGLPGRVWLGGQSLWIPDLARDPTFPRSSVAAADDLHVALGFPVLLGGEVLGVLELFGTQALPPDDDLVRTLASIGGHVGQFAERKRTEEALASTHRQFKALFDSALEAVVVADDERRYVDANEAAAALFGVRREALIGLRMDDFVIATDQGDVAGAWHRFVGEGEQQGEVTLARPDGEIRIVEYSARSNFVPGRHLSIMRDVTEPRSAQREREAAQHRFAVLAELAQTLSQTLDPDAVGERIAEIARALLHTRASILYRLADDGLVVVALSGSVEGGLTRGSVLPPERGVAWLCVRERRPVASPDVLAEPRVSLPPDFRTWVEQGDYRSVLAVPLVGKDVVVGALAIGDRLGRVFGPDEIRVTQAFADHAAIALENARLFALETARRAQVETVAAIERVLAAELDPERLLALIVERVGRLFHGAGGLYLVDGARRLARRAWWNVERVPETMDFGADVVGRVAEMRRGILANDYARSPYAVEAFRDLGTRHAMAQPLIVYGRLLGVISIARLEPKSAAFTADEYETLRHLATQAAIAIDNARLYAEAARGQREAEIIAEVARTINAALDVNAILPLVADAARALTGADSASIALQEPGQETLAFRHQSGQRHAHYDDLRIRPGTGVSGRVITTGRAARCDDVRSNPGIDPDARPLLEAEGIATLLITPFVFGGRVEGLLYLANRRPVPFTAQDEAVVQRLADQGATALRNVNLFAAEQSARSAAEAANRMKDEFLATVSHELRTPLTAMLGWLWWLRRGPVDEAVQARAIETVERNARAQAQLVEDLLDVSRIVTGKLRLDVRPVDLRTTIEAAIDSVRTAADGKGIVLDAHLPFAPAAASVDPDRLQQVVWNLLSNAIKFTPAGGRVDVRLETRPGEACIVVADTGAGISPQFLPYVFDRFRQAESSSTRTYGGLGLGLAIVRHLVELHGGTVRAQSEGEGRGTTFTVTLPVRGVRRIAADELGAREPAGDGDVPARPRGLDGVRVLVVEDADDARDLLVAVLEEQGATVTAVESVAAAREAIARAAPDLLVSDIGMRGEDGYTLIREIRRRVDAVRTVPCVALTAYAGAEDRRRALREGYDVHVAKPVDPGELVAIVVELAPTRRRPGRVESA
jgi:PAS domain S-box-containing protein